MKDLQDFRNVLKVIHQEKSRRNQHSRQIDYIVNLTLKKI